MLLDLILVAMTLMAVVAGHRLGFLTRLAGWAGLATGAILAVILSPELVALTGVEGDGQKLLLSALIVAIGAAMGQSVGYAIGRNLRLGLPERFIPLDRIAGAALGVIGVLVVVWIVAPVLGAVPGAPSRVVRDSEVARWVDGRLPAPPEALTRLEQDLSTGAWPQVFDRLIPAPDVPPPPTGLPLDQGVLARVAESSLRLVSEACGRRQAGSGFVVGPGLVATNAHVVAGAGEVVLSGTDGRRVGVGRVVGFDPARDLAFVRTGATLGAPLPVTPAVPRDTGAVFGFPGGGPFDPSPFQVADLRTARGRDIYDRAQVSREILVLSSDLAQGDSGSAVVRGDGTVIGVAFAIAPDRRGVAYALSVAELAAAADALDGNPVSTGPCLR